MTYLSATTLMLFVGVPIALIADGLEFNDWFELTSTSWLAIMYSGIVASAFVFYATSWAVVRVSPIVVSSFYVVQVCTTAVLSYIALSVSITEVISNAKSMP